MISNILSLAVPQCLQTMLMISGGCVGAVLGLMLFLTWGERTDYEDWNEQRVGRKVRKWRQNSYYMHF